MPALNDRSKLLLLLCLILIAGFMATSVGSYLASRNAIRANIIDRELPLTGDNVYTEIQRDLLRPISISAQMANNAFLRDWVLAGEADMAPLVRYLAEVKREYKSITAFFISERTRKYYYSEGLLKNISESDPRDKWYFRVRQMKEPYELNVDPDESTRDSLVIFINYRVYDYQGNYLGTTGVGLSIDSLYKLVESYERRFQRRIYFVKPSGEISIAKQGATNSTGSIRALPGISTVAESILNNKSGAVGTSYRTENGETVQVNARYLPELKWHLIVEQNDADAVSPVRRILYINLLLSALATVLVLCITWFTVSRYHAKLEALAATDALTGLANRQYGDALCEQAMKDAVRNNAPLSIILLDIDHFKDINDTRGHLAGDAVLKEIALLLKNAVRSNDLVARWGGEEMLVLTKGCALDIAAQLAEKIRRQIAAHEFTYGNTTFNVTASLGVAQAMTRETFENLFTRTDHALYAAKHKGRNRVECAVAET
jgi:diguanylate cyclase (GGDEF)-like protein